MIKKKKYDLKDIQIDMVGKIGSTEFKVVCPVDQYFIPYHDRMSLFVCNRYVVP